MKENNSYYEVLNQKLNKQLNELRTLYDNSIKTITEQQNKIEQLETKLKDKETK